ncbi:hypothetical protein RJP21_04945 [Paenibacillus sp. VCA1]|uniref:hypothetical protein n=1 Tax=Paenibacillus sp. VCA1 TaxID=3039148 RepID=UPI002871FB59|nr:hypothetical protein [Paenibacillus sp. VCA1]MDR9852946.1 hypothetical protein [Paenibacillus sp. VCA1]
MDRLDRFALPDHEPPYVAECEWCRGEIRAGDEVKRIDDGGGYVHNGFGYDCAEKYAEERVYDASGVIDEHRNVN